METAFKCVYMEETVYKYHKRLSTRSTLYLLDTDVFLFYQMLYETSRNHCCVLTLSCLACVWRASVCFVCFIILEHNQMRTYTD